MSTGTHIEWTDATWNPTTGCDKVSAGCDNCYALTLSKRLKAMGNPKYQNDGNPSTSGPGFAATFHEDALNIPAGWRKPRRVFVNSMSDLFHAEIEDYEIARVFAVMSQHPQHTFQVLSKRPARMRSLVGGDLYDLMVRDLEDGHGHVERRITWPLPNVHLGASVETQQWAGIRPDALRATPAAVRFLSLEPLLGPVTVDLTGIDWVIVGGESGPRARPMHPDWAQSVRDQCVSSGVPFLFKQWGEWTPDNGYARGTHLLQLDGHLITRESGTTKDPYGTGSGVQDLVDRGHAGWVRVRRAGKKAAGRELDGRTWDQYPEATR